MMRTCGITLWGPTRTGHVMPVKLCGKPAIGMWGPTPVCEEHLAQHPAAHRGFVEEPKVGGEKG